MADSGTESGTSSPTATETNNPKLCIRTYRPTDREHVDYLFYSTYFALVPEGVKRKLLSPTVWVLWVGVYAYLLTIVPVLLHGMNMPSWVDIALRIFFTVSWALVGFSALFFYTDRFETVDRIEAIRRNDLSDPEIYYLNYNKYEKVITTSPEHTEDEAPRKQGESSSSLSTATTTTTKDNNDNDGDSDKKKKKKKKKRVTFDKDTKPATELVRELLPEDERTPSHFWILEADGVLCGIIGLACYNKPVIDSRPHMGPTWQRLGRWLCDRYGFSMPRMLEASVPTEPSIFEEATPPHTALLQRMTVKYQFQGCGLSSILINRAMIWANDHNIQTIHAVTNELQGTAADILQKRHGFKLVKKVRKGWFGQYEAHWTCNVNTWMEKNQQQQQQKQQ
ncbi:hypothetical protein INT45_013406 [Circinella minor]|uniref:N-acetyltransferase domain-containing protein n=1 Tax=Circinella minor TaxID=1195481 RepID=A0A8H7S5H1_9FUNG|nr:hypothetical protein INT45_013406 [Circinella minor]